MEGKGTQLNIYRAINRTERLRALKPKERTWIFFVDFAKAYDMVNHDRLFKKMENKGLSE